jgi:hypothetical protein
VQRDHLPTGEDLLVFVDRFPRAFDVPLRLPDPRQRGQGGSKRVHRSEVPCKGYPIGGVPQSRLQFVVRVWKTSWSTASCACRTGWDAAALDRLLADTTQAADSCPSSAGQVAPFDAFLGDRARSPKPRRSIR